MRLMMEYNNHQDKKEIQDKIREFSQTTKWKNFLTFLVFVALALIFWVLQYSQQRFEAELSIPVHYIGTPSEIFITNQLPEKINIKVLDKGTILFSYLIKKELAPIEINIKDIPPGKTIYTIDPTIIQKNIYDRLQSSSEVKSVYPEKIEINYSPLAKKEVPIVLNGVLSPALGYTISAGLTIFPKKLIVYGDSNVLDTLNYILTAPVEKREINQNLDISVDLLSPQHIRLSEKEARLTLQVEEYTEKMLEVPITCLRLPKNRIVRFFPSTVEVYIQVGLSHYAKMNSSNFKVHLDYYQLINNPSTSCHLELTEFPPEVLNYRIVPEMAEFLVEQKE